nr:hypothetical protein [Tanacetum cinerariifolium]
ADAVVFAVAVEALELRVFARQLFDPVTEGMNRTVARAVDEVDRALCFQGRFQHRQRRGNPHTTTDQHQRLVIVRQGELARW